MYVVLQIATPFGRSCGVSGRVLAQSADALEAIEQAVKLPCVGREVTVEFVEHVMRRFSKFPRKFDG